MKREKSFHRLQEKLSCLLPGKSSDILRTPKQAMALRAIVSIMFFAMIGILAYPVLAAESDDVDGATELDFEKHALAELRAERDFLLETIAATDWAGSLLGQVVDGEVYAKHLEGVEILINCLEDGYSWNYIWMHPIDAPPACVANFKDPFSLKSTRQWNPVVRLLNEEYFYPNGQEMQKPQYSRELSRNIKLKSEGAWADGIIKYFLDIEYFTREGTGWEGLGSQEWQTIALHSYARLKKRYGAENEPLVLAGAMSDYDRTAYHILIRCLNTYDGKLGKIKMFVEDSSGETNLELCLNSKIDEVFLRHAFATNPLFNGLFQYQLEPKERKEILAEFDEFLNEVADMEKELSAYKTFSQLERAKGRPTNMERFVLATYLEKDFAKANKEFFTNSEKYRKVFRHPLFLCAANTLSPYSVGTGIATSKIGKAVPGVNVVLSLYDAYTNVRDVGTWAGTVAGAGWDQADHVGLLCNVAGNVVESRTGFRTGGTSARGSLRLKAYNILLKPLTVPVMQARRYASKIDKVFSPKFAHHRLSLSSRMKLLEQGGGRRPSRNWVRVSPNLVDPSVIISPFTQKKDDLNQHVKAYREELAELRKDALAKIDDGRLSPTAGMEQINSKELMVIKSLFEKAVSDENVILVQFGWSAGMQKPHNSKWDMMLIYVPSEAALEGETEKASTIPHATYKQINLFLSALNDSKIRITFIDAPFSNGQTSSNQLSAVNKYSQFYESSKSIRYLRQETSSFGVSYVAGGKSKAQDKMRIVFRLLNSAYKNDNIKLLLLYDLKQKEKEVAALREGKKFGADIYPDVKNDPHALYGIRRSIELTKIAYYQNTGEIMAETEWSAVLNKAGNNLGISPETQVAMREAILFFTKVRTLIPLSGNTKDYKLDSATQEYTAKRMNFRDTNSFMKQYVAQEKAVDDFMTEVKAQLK